MAIEEVVTAPRSAWQNAYVERIIGSIRRECVHGAQIAAADRALRVIENLQLNASSANRFRSRIGY